MMERRGESRPTGSKKMSSIKLRSCSTSVRESLMLLPQILLPFHNWSCDWLVLKASSNEIELLKMAVSCYGISGW